MRDLVSLIQRAEADDTVQVLVFGEAHWRGLDRPPVSPSERSEVGLGVIPGGGGIQHLARLIGRARAFEVMLSADDYDAELAERYGWINRALPAETLGDFVRSLAHRIAVFPAAGRVVAEPGLSSMSSQGNLSQAERI